MRWVVLDEADRLLDLGFERDIKEILRIVDKQKKELSPPPPRQTVLIRKAGQ